MKRRLFRVFAAVAVISLLLCLGTLVLRARSSQSEEGLVYGRAGGRYWQFSTVSDGEAELMTCWNWPSDVPLAWVRDHDHVGPSGHWARDVYKAHYDWPDIFVELVESNLYVAEDNHTPLLHGVAVNSFHAGPTSTRMWLAMFPMLYLTAVTAIAPTLFALLLVSLLLRSRRRRWRQQKGLCVACGYDLRGSAGRCPECGQKASPAPVG